MADPQCEEEDYDKVDYQGRSDTDNTNDLVDDLVFGPRLAIQCLGQVDNLDMTNLVALRSEEDQDGV